MKESRHTAVVLEQEQIGEGIFSLWLKTPIHSAVRPGTFVNVYMDDRSHLLPRPISICEADADMSGIRLVYRVAGEGTKFFSGLTEGDEVDILGPLGNGFPETDAQRIMLVGGGIGIPPMLGLAKKYGSRSRAVLGFRTETFLLEDFEKTGCEVLIATEDGSTGCRGTVIDAIEDAAAEADIIFACGPMPMLKAIAAFAYERDIPCFISMEERMACGVGACLGCVTNTVEVDDHSKVNNKRICKDGPVFDSTEVVL